MVIMIKLSSFALCSQLFLFTLLWQFSPSHAAEKVQVRQPTMKSRTQCRDTADRAALALYQINNAEAKNTKSKLKLKSGPTHTESGDYFVWDVRLSHEKGASLYRIELVNDDKDHCTVFRFSMPEAA